MPLPEPSGDESQSDFMSRCMSDENIQAEFDSQDQRVAVCMTQFRRGKTRAFVAYDDISMLVDELAREGKL